MQPTKNDYLQHLHNAVAPSPKHKQKRKTAHLHGFSLLILIRFYAFISCYLIMKSPLVYFGGMTGT